MVHLFTVESVTGIIDTFIVRLFLVPALMFCAVDWNWWPGRLPPAQFDYLGYNLPSAQRSACSSLQPGKLHGDTHAHLVAGSPFSPAASEAGSFVSVN